MNDGTKIQGAFLCFGNGTCIKLAENVIQMGTGKPPVEPKEDKLSQKIDETKEKEEEFENTDGNGEQIE